MRALAAMIAVAVLMGPLSLAVLAQENAPQGWLGVSRADVSAEEAKALGFGKPKGAKIVQIADGSPASLAHLQPGDIVVAADSAEVSNTRELEDRISALPPGTRVMLTLFRSGEVKQQEVILAARAEELPDQRPMLRIEPGMHTAPIKGIGVDAACTLMVTGSHDKTARLWTLPESGRGSPTLLRTLRVPIGEGDDGKIYAVALSPNGKWVAAGGWDARFSVDKTEFIYLFDAATGRLVKRLGRLDNVIHHLAFSPDGNYLAATLGGGAGMRLWESGSWRLLAEDKDYGGKPSLGAAFDGANRLYTVAIDGQIRRYGADGHREANAFAQGGREPLSIAVHPSATKLAIGFVDTTAVEVYDVRTLNRLYAADTGDIAVGNLGSVAWSADGAQLYAGGSGYKVDKKKSRRDLARQRPGPALRSPSLSKHHLPAPALRRRHRVRSIRSRLRPDRGEWRKTSLAGGCHHRHARQRGRCLHPVP